MTAHEELDTPSPEDSPKSPKGNWKMSSGKRVIRTEQKKKEMKSHSCILMVKSIAPTNSAFRSFSKSGKTCQALDASISILKQ